MLVLFLPSMLQSENEVFDFINQDENRQKSKSVVKTFILKNYILFLTRLPVDQLDLAESGGCLLLFFSLAVCETAMFRI